MKKSILIISFFATLMLHSCETQKGQMANNKIIAIDLSGTRDAAILKWYRDIASNNIIHNLGTKESTAVLPIDSGSVQAGQEILIADLSLNNYKNEFAGAQQNEIEMNLHHDSIQALQKRFEANFDNAVSKRKYGGGTDLVGAISEAKKYALPGHVNVLIILSDMLSYQNYGSGIVDFEHGLCDTAEIEGMLAKLPRVDLQGFKVIVVTGSQTNISAAKFNVVKKLWERYFSICHGELKLYTSGSISLLEKELH